MSWHNIPVYVWRASYTMKQKALGSAVDLIILKYKIEMWLNLNIDCISCSLNFTSIHYCFIVSWEKRKWKPWRCNFLPGPALLQAAVCRWSRHKSSAIQNVTEGIPVIPRLASNALSNLAMQLLLAQNTSSKHYSLQTSSLLVSHHLCHLLFCIKSVNHKGKKVNECSSHLLRSCVWVGTARGTQNIRTQLCLNLVCLTKGVKSGGKK